LIIPDYVSLHPGYGALYLQSAGRDKALPFPAASYTAHPEPVEGLSMPTNSRLTVAATLAANYPPGLAASVMTHPSQKTQDSRFRENNGIKAHEK